MRTLEFTIDNNTLINNSDLTNIADTDLKCHFKISGEGWKNCKAAVIFENNEKRYASLLTVDGTCIVPNEVTDMPFFRMYVARKKDNEDTIFTNHVLVVKEV